MDYEITGTCLYCSNPSYYLVGVSKASWKKKIHVTGETRQEHIPKALNKIGALAFGTTYWPAVADPDGKLLYHSFQADQQKFTFVAGWELYLKNTNH